MQLHTDFSQRVVIQIEDLPWQDSPLVGVQRRMLERDGEEVARATSIVRYAPGSYFSAHAHSGGEEFLVLDGVFSDEYGDYRGQVSNRTETYAKAVQLWPQGIEASMQ